MDTDFHLVREMVQNGILRLLPIPSQEQLLDFLTKALAPPMFNMFISKLGMIDIYNAQLKGGY